MALISAISATANEREVKKKYAKLKNSEIKNLPFIVESKIISLKTKELIQSLKKILGNNLFEVMSKKKQVRSGKGKLRGRKYKTNAGLLIVTGKDEKLKTKSLDNTTTKNLSIIDLAKGKQGRLTIYTEKAIKELENKFNNSPKLGQIKELGEKLK